MCCFFSYVWQYNSLQSTSTTPRKDYMKTISKCLAYGSVILVLIVSSQAVFAQALPKKINSHEVSLDSAKKYIANLKKDAMQMKIKGGMFYRDVFDKMLAQKGVIGLRFYFGKTDNGNPTLVAVGVDSTGTDMTSSTIAESIYPCPPFCDTASELAK